MKGVIVEVDIYEEIRKLYLDGISQRSIASKLGISRQTVKKYCNGNTVPWVRKDYERHADVITDEVKAFILGCVEADQAENLRKQKHTSKKIYDRLVEDKGFTGGESTIRKAVKQLKKENLVPPQSIMPLSYQPGEAIQIDWGEATVYINDIKTRLYTFCARLCYSCDIFVMAFRAANQEAFLEAQQLAFNYFKGIPKRVIFDNAKVAVKEGFGLYAKPQNKYFSFSAHYAFSLDFCNPAKGNEKGLVENLVGYSRRNFLVPVPRLKSIQELNQNLLKSCLKYRETHKIQGKTSSVKTMYAEELKYLSAIPRFKFDTSKTAVAVVDDCSTVRYEKNNYSVPTKYLRQEVTVKGYGNYIKIVHRNVEIASFDRCYYSGRTQYKLEHYIDLLERKPRSVLNARPVKENIVNELLEWGALLTGGNKEMVKLLRLCVDYGQDRILSIKHMIPSNIVPSVDMVRTYLDEPIEVSTIYIKNDIEVDSVDLKKYDKKYGMVV